MPIPDPDKIWPKLEKAGVEEVKKKLSMGVFAKYKIPVIEEWIRQQDKEASYKKPPSVEQEKSNRVDQFISWAKNHTILSIVIILCTIIIAVGSLTDSISNISNFFNGKLVSLEVEDTRDAFEKRDPIEIKIYIESSWDEFSELDRKAEFYIVRSQSPGSQVVVYSGSAKVEIPEKGLTVNEWISISPHTETKTRVILPKSEALFKFLDEGGYEIQLVLFNKYGRIFNHVEQKLFDKEILNKGIRYWFRLIPKQIP